MSVAREMEEGRERDREGGREEREGEREGGRERMKRHQLFDAEPSSTVNFTPLWLP